MKRKLTSEEREELLATLKARFEKNRNRHKDLQWVKVQAKLETNPEKMWTLNEMEKTGGEPDGAESYYAARGFRGSLRV